MAEAKVGEEFIKHELDEAIAIQRSIVRAEEALGRDHPSEGAKRVIRAALKEDQRYLRELENLGRPKGATGKAEEIALALDELMSESSQKAAEAESEAYEAHAVLVNLKRKQQDSSTAMLKIARAMRDTEMRDAAREFSRATKTSAQQLADELAAFAVVIATAGNGQSSARRGSSRSGTTSRSA